MTTTYTVIVTAYKEPDLVPKAIESIILSNSEIINKTQLIVVCGDDLTHMSALHTLSGHNFDNFLVLKDNAQGKSEALNLAFKKATGDIWIMTDGDIYMSKDAISKLVTAFNNEQVVGATANVRSLDNKNTFFGYYSHLFCDAANKYRLSKQSRNEFFPLSGYLYAIRKPSVLILPKGLMAEDDYISHLIYRSSLKFVYVHDAIAYVMFAKNLKDLFKQKLRSLGGNVQNQRFFNTDKRSIFQDIKMSLFPLFYATNIKELGYSFLIYPLRFYLWIAIYYQHIFNNYKAGAWDRVESSKY